MIASTEGDGAVRKPEHAFPLGLIWLKGQERVDLLGLGQALGVVAHVHKGVKAPLGQTPPSAVICFPTGEDDLAAQVSHIRRNVASEVPVLVFASAPDLRLARAVLRAEAGGLIHSGMSEEQVRRAVSVAIGGEVVLPRELLVHWRDEQRLPALNVLSARRREIMEFVVEGLSTAEVARHLWVAESSIKQHLGAIYKALGVRTRNEAANLYLRMSGRSGYRGPVYQQTQHSSGSRATRAHRRC